MLDKQACAEAHNWEYLRFVELGVFKVARPEPGVRIHKALNSDFLRVQACKESDLYVELIRERHLLLLLKSIYGTRQAARKWHEHISSWMKRNGYAVVSSEKTIFMKRSGSE